MTSMTTVGEIPWRHSRFAFTLAFGFGFLLAPWTQAQTSKADAALRDRVLQLVERLGAEKTESRDAAQASLIKLGAKILPLLPAPETAGNPEKTRRLEEIRKAVAETDDQASTKPSRITIQGKGIRLSEAIQQLQKQSGNTLTDLREQLGVEATNPSLDLDISNQTFFEALDEIARKAEITPNFFTGDGSIGLTGGTAPTKAFLIYTGPFRIMLKQLGLVRDFQAGSAVANAQLDVAWEPRLRPMLLALKTDELKIVDDQGKPVTPQVDMESTEVVLRPENPVAEINLNLSAPERSAKSLKSVKVKAEVTIPSGMKTFRFPSLVQENVNLSLGSVSALLQNMEVEEEVWKVNLELTYPGSGPAFESYRQGLFNNRVWLQKADGSRFELNGGFFNTSAEGGKLGFEYLFVDVPGKPADYQLVYETPSKVLTVPLEFEFKDIPLP